MCKKEPHALSKYWILGMHAFNEPDRAFGARPLPYKTIIELDKKTKEFYIPPSLQVPGFGGSKVGIDAQVEQPPIELVMQRYVAWAMREISMYPRRHSTH